MSTELTLIRAIIDGRMEGSMQDALRLGVDYEKFGDFEAKSCWKYLFEHWRDKAHPNTIPSLDLFNARFPDIDLPAANDPIGVIVDLFNHEYTERTVRDSASKLLSGLGGSADPLDLIDLFRSSIAPLRAAKERATAKPLSVLVKRHILDTYLDDNINLGFPWPWEFLNEHTPGMCGGNLYVYYGRPTSMKSWYLAHTLSKLLKGDLGLRALVLSGDMPEEDFTEYLLCCLAGIPVWRLRRRDMKNKDFQEMIAAYERIEQLEKEGGFIQIVSLPGITASELSAMALDIGANFMAVDALYRMKDERTGRTTTEPVVQSNIVQSLKDVALSLNIPVLATTQANRAGEDPTSAGQTMTEQAFTDAIAQEAAFLMRILSLKDIENSSDRVLYFPKVRKVLSGDAVPLKPQRVGGMPAVNFRPKGSYEPLKKKTDRIKKSGPEGGSSEQPFMKKHSTANNMPGA